MKEFPRGPTDNRTTVFCLYMEEIVAVLRFARALSINPRHNVNQEGGCINQSRHNIKREGGRTGSKATITLPRRSAACELFMWKADNGSSRCSVRG